MHSFGKPFDRTRSRASYAVTLISVAAVGPSLLVFGAGSSSPQPAPPSDSSAQLLSYRTIDPSVPPAGPYLAQAEHYSSEIAMNIGHPLSLPLSVVVNSVQLEGPNTGAYAAPLDSSGGQNGTATRCVIFIDPFLYRHEGTAEANLTIAHEVFHCFQAMDYSSIPTFLHAPRWLIEGEAEWVGATLVPFDDDFWNAYLLDLTTPLFTRSYDAIGFYALMTESGIDTWHLLDPMLKVGSSAAAYALAANSTLKEDWASSLARQPSFGQEWDANGPDITNVKYNPAVTVLRTGTVLGGKVAPYTNALIPFSPATDVVHITTTTAYSRLHTGNGANYDQLDMQPNDFCNNQCGKCPEMKAMPRIGGSSWLAVTGDIQGASYRVTGEKAMCNAPCIVGTWTVTNETSQYLGIREGGAGAIWTVDPDGTISVDWAESTPVVLAIGKSFTYRGEQTEILTPSSLTEGSTGQWLIASTSGNATATSSDGTVTPLPAYGGGTGTWTCGKDSMTVTTNVYGGGGTVVTTYTRN
jgi:hypothetical protein